jgi:DNA-binding SARP family transcriptional activator/DNA-binding GntR family transcriptional regulator
MSMEFRVLGPLEVSDGDSSVALGGRKQQALLARLVLDVNRMVAVDRLVDDLWGEEAPPSAAKMIQIHVSKLRKVLPPGMLRTQPPGYMLVADTDGVDATRFRALREAGHAALAAGDPTGSAARLREALALWRGAPLAEFEEPFARAEAAHLEALRLACVEERIDADLALGRHRAVVAELERLAPQHPLREALHRQLMLALYRTGRQGEALAAYERFRRRLDDELGIEPTPALKELHLGILNQDPRFDAAPPRPPAAAPARRGARAPLAGRAAERAALESALAAAAAGRGGTALVSGPAGIGKTRLIADVAALAREQGATVLTGRCIHLIGSGLPYLPLAEALRPLRGSPLLRELAGALHELPRVVPGLTGEDEAPGGPACCRLQLFEEVLALLGRLSEHGPVVLVFEDLHWADESTLDLVAYLAHAMPARRVLFLGSYRSDEVRPGDPLHRIASGLIGDRTATQLALAPLPRDALLALLDDGELPPAVAEEIAVRSEGNPLFARELQTAARNGERALPPALRDLLLAKIGRLGRDATAVARIAAAAGRDVSYALLAAVVPIDELALADAMRDAVEQGVLEPVPETGGFRFRHALFGEAVYGTLLPGERERAHERIARALTEDPVVAAGGGPPAAELAQHWSAAGRPVEALEASLRAAREAEAVAGLAEALQHVERVLELWDEVPGAEQLAGLALPSILAWAAELVGSSTGREDALDARVLVNVLGPTAIADVAAAARRMEVPVDAAAAALTTLEREGLVERLEDGAFRAAPLAVAEARRLYPSAVVLESLAVRVSPPAGRMRLDALRRANARFRQSRDDPAGAVLADDEFHVLLIAGCENEHLLTALRPIKRALLRYEHVFMADPERIERSAVQHEAIIAALAAGDRAGAAQLVRQNLAYGLPDLTEALEQ